jgi:hypothetical protein
MQEAQWCWLTVTNTVDIHSRLIGFTEAYGLDECSSRSESCHDGANMVSIIY